MLLCFKNLQRKPIPGKDNFIMIDKGAHYIHSQAGKLLDCAVVKGDGSI